ncbi:phospholipase-like protein [Tanacetum coccineum]
MKTLRIASGCYSGGVRDGGKMGRYTVFLGLTGVQEKDPNDYDPCAPNSHHEDEEVSSDEDVDEWLNAELETEEGDSSETLPCQLPPKQMNPGSFTLPCTIGNLKLYVMADLGASVNVMPKSLFKHLKLADLKETSMMVGMADITKKSPLGIVDNILVKINKFLFHSDFVVIDMLEGPNETMLLDKPFLATIHAQIDVFRREISLGIGEEKESEYFNPLKSETDVFSYDSPACLLFKQSTHPRSDESIDTVDSSDDMQELEGSQEDEVGSHPLENVVSRWHVCKPVRVTVKDCEKDCVKGPTCNPDLSFCSGYDAIYGEEESGMLKQWICFRDHERHKVGGNGMIFADFLKVRYGNKNIDDSQSMLTPYDFQYEYPHPYIPQESDSPPNDTLHINTYFPDVFQTQLKKPRLRDNSFEEWVKIKLGHTNISETIKCEMFKEWVKENFNFKVDFRRTHDDPYSRRFDVYKEKFDCEIEQLANEYDLKVGMKKYALDDIWEKCERF